MPEVKANVFFDGEPGSSAICLPGESLRLQDGAPVLIGGECSSCGLQTFPRSTVCSGCMSEEVAETQMPNLGVVYSLSTVHVGPPGWHKPFMLGYVDLPNNVRVFSHLRGDCKIGDKVTLDIGEVGRDINGTPITSFVFKSGGV
jgi:benzoylsuccinyl-CoA thiolase BbsA subunit